MLEGKYLSVFSDIMKFVKDHPLDLDAFNVSLKCIPPVLESIKSDDFDIEAYPNAIVDVIEGYIQFSLYEDLDDLAQHLKDHDNPSFTIL